MTNCGGDAAPPSFAQVVVVLDRTLTANGAGRRTLQLCAELHELLPQGAVRVVSTEGARPHAVRRVDPVGAELLSLDWLSHVRFQVTSVVLTGPASSRRALPLVQQFQPQATVLALLPEILPLPSGLEARYDVREEQLGSAYVQRVWEERRDHVLGQVDGVLLETGVDVLPLGQAPHAVRYGYDLRVDGGPGVPLAGRRGLLSWGWFGAEHAEPDEEAAILVDGPVRRLINALAPNIDLQVALENAPTGLRAFAPSHPRRDAIAAARVLLLARRFGDRQVAEALAAEAAELGTPVVALREAGLGAVATEAADAADLARLGVRLATDPAAWEAAREAQARWAGPRSSRHTATQLVKVLADIGVPVSGRPAAPIPPDPPAFHAGPKTTQGQVQTEGLAEFRPTSPAFARADIPQDSLWPHLAYEPWWEAHPFTDETRSVVGARATQLPTQPLVSLVMPVYDTDPEVLTTAIESVLAQTYPFWELCAVDDASPSEVTAETLRQLASRDDRIRIDRLPANEGIVGASNAALAMATGEFIALLDHDDVLSPEALFEVVALVNEEPDLDFLYSDEDKLDLDDRRVSPFFKPSWSPHLHLGVNYVTHFAVYRRRLLDAIGGFRPGFDGSQDYDLSLRASEHARRIGHIAKPIYTWRMVPGSAAVAHDAKPYALDAARRAIGDALARRGRPATVERGLVPGTWRPRYAISPPPLVSLLIPTRNGHQLLERCISTVLSRTTYRRFEIVIVDNASDDPDTLAYLRAVDAKVVRYPQRFNYARQMNLAVAEADGDQVLFLNNDMEVISPGWLEAMVELAQHSEVGAVGARLLFPGGRPQHEGVFIGFGGGSAGNVDFGDYFGLGRMIRDATAVTAACMLMRTEPFHAVGGFDERLRVAFNDVDLCLRLRQAGYQIVYTPYAELFHAESASRGKLHPEEDEAFFVRRWGPPGAFRDPFYNPNLDAVRPFRLRR